MRLVSLSVWGFRGFAKPEVFDLDADCIVLVGANGSGKTSFLDSILWALTGSVSRLDAEPAVVRSKYSQNGETQVSLTLRDGEETGQVEVTRTLEGDGAMQVIVRARGKTTKGPSAEGQLIDLLWPDAASTADPAEALASVIASSVYLQQDLVRGFIDSTSEEDRFRAVGELVGAGRVTDLQLRLEKAKLAWSKATNQFQESHNQLRARSRTLEAQRADILSRNSTTSAGNPETQWNTWWKSVERLGIKPAAIAFSAKDAPARLDSGMKYLTAFERTAGRRLQMLTSIQEDLEAIGTQPMADIPALSEKCAVARTALEEQRHLVEAEQGRLAEVRSAQLSLKERSDQLKALAELALNLLDGECPVCGQEHDRDATSKRLRKIIAAKEHSPGSVQPAVALPLLLTTLEVREKFLSNAESQLRIAQEDERQSRLREQSVARQMTDLGLDSARGQPERLKAVAAAIKETSEQIRTSSAHRESGEVLSLQLSQSGEQGRGAELKREIDELQTQLSDQEGVLNERMATGDLGQRIVEALRSAASGVVMERLAQLAPLVQAIYSRIDPHPSFRAVNFLSRMANKRGRLNTVITDEHSKIESEAPETILSSSQMNALAVSVFLGLNLGSSPPIDAVMLDDPLQSLDDVNLLGVVDLLRRTKDQRQLLVSTHDDRFGELLARKLRPTSGGQRTVVIELSGWSREGPIARQRQIEADSVPLRLVASGRRASIARST